MMKQSSNILNISIHQDHSLTIKHSISLYMDRRDDYLQNAHENERIHISLVLANNQTDSSSIQFYIVYVFDSSSIHSQNAVENTSLVWMNILLILVSMTLVLVALLISLNKKKKYVPTKDQSIRQISPTNSLKSLSSSLSTYSRPPL